MRNSETFLYTYDSIVPSHAQSFPPALTALKAGSLRKVLPQIAHDVLIANPAREPAGQRAENVSGSSVNVDHGRNLMAPRLGIALARVLTLNDRKRHNNPSQSAETSAA